MLKVDDFSITGAPRGKQDADCRWDRLAAAMNLCFYCIKWLEVFKHPLDGMLGHYRFTPSISFVIANLHLGTDTKYPSQKCNIMIPARAWNKTTWSRVQRTNHYQATTLHSEYNRPHAYCLSAGLLASKWKAKIPQACACMILEVQSNLFLSLGSHWQLHAHYYPPLLRSATVRSSD